MFALKCELKERPYVLVTFSILILIFVCGYGVRAAEL